MAYEHKDEVVEYLKRNLIKGYPIDSLKIALAKQGYPKLCIEQAVRKVNEELAKQIPIVKEKPKIKYQIMDENNRPIKIKKNIWERFLGI